MDITPVLTAALAAPAALFAKTVRRNDLIAVAKLRPGEMRPAGAAFDPTAFYCEGQFHELGSSNKEVSE